MDKLSLTSANESALSFQGDQTAYQGQETLFQPKKWLLKISSELTTLLINFHKQRWERYEAKLSYLQTTNNASPNSGNGATSTSFSISKAITEAVLQKLHAFEQEHGYLSTSVSLMSLSTELGTNSSYLSKIINHTKGKTFKKYLNDLRVAHAHTALKTNPIKRKYTIEALAFDFGFKSAENFSKKFKEVYGMYPSKYLRQLRT